MRHCCDFRADDIYFLKETSLYTMRKLSVGFCPICSKPVAELVRMRFDGPIERLRASGIEAHEMMIKYKDEINYSLRECNFMKFKSKPYGWKYGVNKSVKSKGKEVIKQFAYDFYGNKELIKTF
ncbi:MAG: hypothetical protein E7Z89_06990 [Cyanobacteria bacterium SIG28]|nr:hypothetical protein [Cyanobacteria bacterium SIG28]